MRKIARRVLWGYAPVSVLQFIHVMQTNHQETCQRLDMEIARLTEENEALRLHHEGAYPPSQLKAQEGSGAPFHAPADSLKRTFLGWDMKKVSAHIRQLRNLQEQERREREAMLDELRLENQQLRRELEPLQAEIEHSDPEPVNTITDHSTDVIEMDAHLEAAVTTLVEMEPLQSTMDFTDRNPSLFWGDIDGYLTGGLPDPLPAPPPSPPREEKSEEFESDVIADEIMLMRNRYIVGKWAGEDLFTRDGLLIVAKHTPITPEIVARADREGKLAELIVNMKIPGMGDEKSQ